MKRTYCVATLWNSCGRGIDSSSSLPTTTMPSGSSTSIRSHLKILQNALEEPTCISSGVLPVREDDLRLCYKQDNGTGWNCINSGSTSDRELRYLSRSAACHPETNIHSAGFLGLSDFMAGLDVGVVQSIVEAITQDLLAAKRDEQHGSTLVRAELSKLNVYGPGSFFDGQKEEPVGSSHIGSLVIVLPTQHKGGVLKFSSGDDIWTFDPAKELEGKTASIAYIASLNDVTKNQEPVHDGYRLTLTYNLFVENRLAVLMKTRAQSAAEKKMAASIGLLLANKSFLPSGGLLGFGLQHRYPIPRTGSDKTPLAGVLALLRGVDARIKTAADLAGVPAIIRLVYETDSEGDLTVQHRVAASKMITMYGFLEDAEFDQTTEILYSGELLCPVRVGPGKRKREAAENLDNLKPSKKRKRAASSGDSDSEQAVIIAQIVDELDVDPDRITCTDIHWITDLTEINAAASDFVDGDEKRPNVDYCYGYAALFLRVPSHKDRKA
ncbi:hypothetical protein C8F01DRAFT_1143076 [Mycena amicta]|nr:hypothetical protein C8F01DRAFT_1143076 [Mycena amicta]